MKRITLAVVLALLVAGLSGCRCIAQGVNGLGKDFQAWTQPYVEEQQQYSQK